MYFRGSEILKKKLIGIIICILLIGNVITVTGNIVIDKNPLSMINGKTLYVGGDGPGNYTKIQDAIDDANDGDTVFVFDDSSPYYENVIVGNSINLIGENRDTTFIMGDGEIITVFASNVLINGFSIERSGKSLSVGILIKTNSSGNVVSNNIIQNHNYGIFVLGSNNTIYGNFIIKNSEGIRLDSIGNIDSINNIIYRNEIAYSEEQSIFIELSHSNQIYENNFKRSLFMYPHIWWICDIFQYFKYPSQKNVWFNNYWDIARIGPKLIGGWLFYWWGDDYGIPFLFPWFNIDYNPAQEPYNI